MRLEIRCDGKCEKFCKIFWELNKAWFAVSAQYSLGICRSRTVFPRPHRSRSLPSLLFSALNLSQGDGDHGDVAPMCGAPTAPFPSVPALVSPHSLYSSPPSLSHLSWHGCGQGSSVVSVVDAAMPILLLYSPSHHMGGPAVTPTGGRRRHAPLGLSSSSSLPLLLWYVKP